jgi:hypothetical protein
LIQVNVGCRRRPSVTGRVARPDHGGMHEADPRSSRRLRAQRQSA